MTKSCLLEFCHVLGIVCFLQTPWISLSHSLTSFLMGVARKHPEISGFLHS